VDRALGRILQALPSKANVILLGSVGLQDQYPTVGLIESFCRQLGYQPAAAPTAASRLRPRDLARRLMPRALRKAVAGTLSRERQEHLLAQSFREGTDWSRTRAFALPTNHTSMIRVNLRGREPQGTVESGEEYDALLQELSVELGRLTDPVTDQPVVHETVRTDRTFGCETPTILPDLFVQWAPCARFLDRVHHPWAELSQAPPDFFRGTEHRAEGFLAACGPSVSGRGDLGAVKVLDLAPTFLRLLGQESGPGMRGRPVAALCSEEKA
jgi:predicted AlkP superfamily phosphohydrolase/phosphomutase